MTYLLSIETALDICSVALSGEEKIIKVKEEKGFNIHSSRLTVFIEELFRESGIERNELSAIIVSKGPGSYTGLRIGVSVAKGLAYALDIPLIAINTLQAMSKIALKQKSEINNPQFLYCPMIDARRMEVYWNLYDDKLEEFSTTKASIIDEEFINNLPKDKSICFFGNGMPKCREILSTYPNAYFMEDIEPSATPLIHLGYRKFLNSAFEDVSSFEPFYLKEFYTNAKVV